MSDTTKDEFNFDPMDQSKTKDWALLARIREECPVSRPAEHVVLTTKFADTSVGYRDAKRFSSVGDMRAPGVVVPEEESFLGEIDAPLHPKIRRLLLKGFTPAAAAASEAWTRTKVRGKYDQLKSRGRGDLMADLATPLPGSVAAHQLGLDDDTHDQVMVWCNELLHSTWVAMGETERGVGIEGAFPELAALLDENIAQRRSQQPGESDDLISLMVHSRDADGWHLGDQHIRTLCVNILAGSLSASYMIGNLVYRYLDPATDFASTIRENPSLISNAVEESLRFEAPVVFLFRTVRGDTEIGGCPVHSGEHLMLHIGAANRDEDAYPDGESFRLDRDGTPEHLAFGAGPHLCLGNHLTRMVGRVVLEELLDAFAPGELQLAEGFEWVCVDHLLEYGPDTLDVVVR